LNWEQEQERLILEARLLTSSREVVFEDLKKLAAKTTLEGYRNRNNDYEMRLLQRNERLINLGLAAYGTSKEVLKTLYKHSLEPAKDAFEANYKNALRVACISNSTAPTFNLMRHYPDDIIGAEQTHRIIIRGQYDEVTALIDNPKVSENLLKALYSRNGSFTQIDQERWLQMIHLSASNARLRTEYEYQDSPDIAYLDIHRSIFELLAKAPLNYHSMRSLYHLLDNLNFRRVHSPPRIDHVLSRWAQFSTTEDRDISNRGYWTRLSFKDEFRCLIASLYNGGYADNKSINFGNCYADDVALRCAYYANTDLTKKDMQKWFAKDGEIFVFAAILNSRVHKYAHLRELMETEYLSGDTALRWLKYDEQLREAQPSFVPPVSDELPVETKPKDETLRSITELRKLLSVLDTRLSGLRRLIIVVAIVLAILIYFQIKYR
jgi:hypothetical protein